MSKLLLFVVANKKFLIVASCTVLIFVILRWLFLKESLLFYNDMGRDAIVLLDWATTGKPPLLGPQTSVLSYNQSAWYFYFLFPFFLISNYSAFSSTATVTAFGAIVLVWLFWLTRRDTVNLMFVMIMALLLAVHPQVVTQNRFVWNPSFIPYFLMAATVCGLLLRKEYKSLSAAFFWLSLAFAAGFSYSAVPFSVVLALYLITVNKKYWKQHLFFACSSAMIVLLPTIVFEVRHSFALTKLFFEGQTTPQVILPLSVRAEQLISLIFPGSTSRESFYCLVFVVTSMVAGIVTTLYTKDKRSKLVMLTSCFLVINISLQLILPINLEKHYIFPLLIALFASIAVLPQKFSIPIAALLVLFWLRPYFISMYTAVPVRTVSDLEQCYKNYCEATTSPIYVSMESGILSGYHNAPEHRFFMRKMGCTVFDIETTQDQATTMVVVNDAAKIDLGKSGYRELSLFGPYTAGEKINCTDNLSLQELHKPTEETNPELILQPQ